VPNIPEETKVKTANSTHNEINTPSKPLHIGNQIVDKMPMFEACKDVVTEEQIKCFKNNLDKHVISTFTYPPSALEQGIQGRRFKNVSLYKRCEHLRQYRRSRTRNKQSAIFNRFTQLLVLHNAMEQQHIKEWR